MKKLVLLLLFTTALITFAQEFQISNSGIYSVDVPHVAIGGPFAHIIHGTNFNCYNFGIDGPQSPIDNPTRPADNFGPNTTDIAVDPFDSSHIAIAYYDFHYDYDSGIQFYGCYITESFDGGITFDVPTLLDTIQYGNSLSDVAYNIPQVKFLTKEGESTLYVLWRVISNKRVTNALYLGVRYADPERMDDPNKDVLEKAIGFTVEDMYAVSYAIMEDGNVKFYLSGSGINGPVLVKNVGQTFLTADAYSKAFINHGGRIKYVYNDYNHAASLVESQDWGATWEDKGIVDNHQYTYVAFTRIQPTYPYYLESYYVKLLIDNNNDLVYSVSADLLNWQEGGKVNSSDAQVTGMASSFIDLKLDDVNKFLVTTWIDNRTGNDEIFYGKASLPELVSVNDKEEFPIEFSLNQNYPNPFNPSTTISFALPRETDVRLMVYNSIGEEVAELINGNMSAGYHSVNFNATNLSSGLYFYRISATNGSGQGFVEVKKMLLVK